MFARSYDEVANSSFLAKSRAGKRWADLNAKGRARKLSKRRLTHVVARKTQDASLSLGQGC